MPPVYVWRGGMEVNQYKTFISVFHDMGYFEAVNTKAKESMKMATLEEISTPFCQTNNGVVLYIQHLIKKIPHFMNGHDSQLLVQYR